MRLIRRLFSTSAEGRDSPETPRATAKRRKQRMTELLERLRKDGVRVWDGTDPNDPVGAYILSAPGYNPQSSRNAETPRDRPRRRVAAERERVFEMLLLQAGRSGNVERGRFLQRLRASPWYEDYTPDALWQIFTGEEHAPEPPEPPTPDEE